MEKKNPYLGWKLQPIVLQLKKICICTLCLYTRNVKCGKQIKIDLKFHYVIYSLSTLVEGTIVSSIMKFSTNQPPQPYPEKGLLNVNNILNEDVEQKLHMI